MQALPAAAALVDHAERILLTTHVNPDGDAIGSILALAECLRTARKRVDVVLGDTPPEYCNFLTGFDSITLQLPTEDPNLAIVCDAAGADRVGSVEPILARADAILEIDHHLVTRPFGTVRLVDDCCFASAEMVYELLIHLGAAITPSVATSLMMGVATDTGVFRYTNVNARAFALSSQLMQAGADLATVVDRVYEQKTVASLALMGRAFSHFHVEPGFAVASLTLQDFADSSAVQADSEGIVNYLRSLRGVKIAALLREAGPTEIRISLRSRPDADVAVIAEQFGGGGHRAASGCTIHAPLAEAEDRLCAALRQALGP